MRGDMLAGLLTLVVAIGCDGGEAAPVVRAEEACEAEVDAPAPAIAPAPAPAPAAVEDVGEPALAAPLAVKPEPVAAPRTLDAVQALSPEAATAFRKTIRQVVRMPQDRALQRRARAHKMRLVDLTWEDTGRWLGSSVGPNISDLTLEVIERRPKRRARTHLLPVLRYPNFSDRTADVPADRFFVYVGNQREGAAREAVSLPKLLGNLTAYLSEPESFRARKDDLTASRDTHYLVSAQHVFVPVPDGVRVEFAPVLFNYQSNPGEPAVLCILATREGTSVQIIENRPDAGYPDGWGQRLYFNRAGQRSTFTAERRSDVAERVERGEARPEDATALEEGADMVMIIQVPLVLPHGSGSMGYGGGAIGGGVGYGKGASLSGAGIGSSAGGIAADVWGGERPSSDVEAAVIGHGLDEGPFTEIRRQRIRRDRRFPIRVTIQFYRATSNGVVSEADLDAAAAQIERVYSDAEFVGSLVVGSQDRPTAWAGSGAPG